jgi:hypothetical protein
MTPEAKHSGAATKPEAGKRKAWIKKSPVEIILEQVRKQEQKVNELKKELAKEEAELKKMQKATELLGSS